MRCPSTSTNWFVPYAHLFSSLYLQPFTLSGIVVKCHKDRQLHRNRKLARELLIDHLDQHINGEDSLAEQKKRYVIATSISYEKKAAELRARKKAYKESLKEKKSTDTQSDSPSPDLSTSEEEVPNLKP